MSRVNSVKIVNFDAEKVFEDAESVMGRSKVRHGLSRTTLYKTWSGMIQRCENVRDVRYPGYGGRGITVCPEWRENFGAFAKDMGPKPTPDHSIDRIDGHKGYSPENCRWATKVEQRANTKRAAHHRPRTHCKRGHPFSHRDTQNRQRCAICIEGRLNIYAAKRAAARQQN